MPLFARLSSRAVRSLAAVMLGLSVSAFAGLAQAQVASPLGGGPRLTEPATPTAGAAANAKLFERTCSCEVSCNGTSFSTASEGPNGPVVTTPMRNECKKKCDAWVQANINQWATQLGTKACKTMQCAGGSKLSTGDSITLGPFNLDTSGFPACKEPPLDGNKCCPEFTKALTPSQLGTLFTESAHGIGQPYTMAFSSNGAFSNAFENYLKEWAHWLSVDGCKGVTGFALTYQLFNTNSSTKPTGPNPPSGSGPVVYTQTVIYSGTSVSPGSFVWSIPASPNWWFVKVSVAPIGQDGKPVQCAKAGGCMDRMYTGWIDAALTTMKTAPGAAQAAGVRILD